MNGDKNGVNPVRNSSGPLNPAGIVLKCHPSAEQRGLISNGEKSSWRERIDGEKRDITR
jgi:hypothetical protein